ncbi:phospholipid carrier-dependent glycosyltransferase [Patescibacteria group bacterium]|nr:phospholipid carrier-dependent glycosyltransferase [Patescibacteria group bacterium]
MFSKKSLLIILLALAIITRFFYFNHPAEVVFDEVHFGSFVRAYFTHEYYFDIHPPLGKLLIAGMAKIGKTNVASQEDFSKIGQGYDAHDLFMLRLLPVIASILFVLLIYLLVLFLTKLPIAAFAASFMVLFDNSLIVQSRIALLDIFLLFFGFLAIYLFLLSENKNSKQKWFLIILSGLSLGTCYSIKWTGFSMIFAIGLLALYQLFKNKKWKEFFIKLITVYILSFILYTAVFAIHFSLLKDPGPGNAYMSQNFKEETFAKKFYELNEKMFFYNKGITSSHPFQSKWYHWPINQKPIFYWQKNPVDLNDKQEIWLMGNLTVWLMASLAVVVGFFMILIKLIFKKPKDFSLFIPSFLIAGWLANFLPFIPINRPLFMYSYFLALIFSIMLFAYLFAYLIKKLFDSKNKKRIVLSLFILVIVLGFLFCANLTYGI